MVSLSRTSGGQLASIRRSGVCSRGFHGVMSTAGRCDAMLPVRTPMLQEKRPFQSPNIHMMGNPMARDGSRSKVFIMPLPLRGLPWSNSIFAGRPMPESSGAKPTLEPMRATPAAQGAFSRRALHAARRKNRDGQLPAVRAAPCRCSTAKGRSGRVAGNDHLHGQWFELCRRRREPIPGPSTEYFGNLAKKHALHLVVGLVERDCAAHV